MYVPKGNIDLENVLNNNIKNKLKTGSESIERR